MDTKQLEGRIAIVTGAGRGIGRSIALTLARAGARVSLAARTEVQLEAVRAEIEAIGGQAVCYPLDISREADVMRLVKGTVDHFGRIDIVVNNAGVGVYGPLEQTSTASWDHLMAVNARGPFLLCREAIPYLRKNRRSFIVNISSVMGVKGYPNQSAYTASKHAILGMSKVLAKEVHQEGIRVHVICPGGVDTDLVGQARPDLNRAELIAPQEIADVVLFLVTQRGNAAIDEVHVRRDTTLPWA